jgi:hypothetical protein
MAQDETQYIEQDVGEGLLGWETWEFPPQERSKLWYVIASLIAVGLIVYAVYTANYIFAIAIMMLGIITLIGNFRKPRRIEVFLTNLGVVVGSEFYAYEDLKDFSIVYKPPVKNLYLDFKSVWQPMISIPIEEMNPNEVREVLLPYAFENLEREDENLTDVLRRLYKL